LIGEDVTENVRTVESAPLLLMRDFSKVTRTSDEIKKIFEEFPRVRRAVRVLPRHLEMRGEIYMTRSAFAAVNREQKKNNLPVYANPRNIAAGSIRQLDPKIAAARRLDFLAYDLVTELGQETHEEEHLIAKVLGFKTVEMAEVCASVDEVIAFWRKVGEKREALPYLIDGVVVQLNRGRDFKRLGIAGKAPRAAIAFKFAAAEATTILRDIIVQIGRTGVLTPVAVMDPVNIGGVTVSRATLHNQDEIRRLGVKIGDTVIVERAGDVIPAVKSILRRLRPKNAKPFSMPRVCPICGSKVVRKQQATSDKRQDLSVAYYCTNSQCAAVQHEMLYHFVSKKAFDIQGLGPKIVDVLLDQGLIRDAADFFTLKKEDVEILERFGEKSADNLIRSIAEKKSIAVSRFIYALGIPHVGEETAIELAAHFGSVEKLASASSDDLQRVKDIGGVVAVSVVGWFTSARNRELLKKLERTGVYPLKEKAAVVPQTLRGNIFVLTGILASLTRDQAKEKIRARGGDVSGSVSKKTTYLVLGEEPGSKLEAAKRLGVKTISEKEFLALIG